MFETDNEDRGQVGIGTLIVFISDGKQWFEGVVAAVTVDIENLSSGDHRVTVIANGDRATFEFYQT